jgi:hypothetical protein
MVELVADHERIWATHQVISDPSASRRKVLRRKHNSAGLQIPSSKWRPEH